jgi:hypothetical protein
MGDLNTLHSHAKRIVFNLKEGLEQLESAEVRAHAHARAHALGLEHAPCLSRLVL